MTFSCHACQGDIEPGEEFFLQTGTSPPTPEGYPYCEDCKTEILVNAGAELSAAYEKLYRLTDGDEAQVGEIAYECNKVGRINAAQQED